MNKYKAAGGQQDEELLRHILDLAGWIGDETPKEDDLGPIAGTKETRWWHSTFVLNRRRSNLLSKTPPRYLDGLEALGRIRQLEDMLLSGGLQPGTTMWNYSRALHDISNGMGHVASAREKCVALLQVFRPEVFE